jgi:transposase
MPHYLGIDVSKKELVISGLFNKSSNKSKIKKISNKPDIIHKWVSKLSSAIHVIFEATGVYSKQLEAILAAHHIAFSRLNPRQSSGFITGVLLDKNKTDDSDAAYLAAYGRMIEPGVSQAESPKQARLRQLRANLNYCIKQQTAITNKLHALSYEAHLDTFNKGLLEEQLALVKKQIAALEKELVRLSETHFKKKLSLVTSIKGIGIKTAMALLIVSDGFSGFDNSKQLAKFLGICPTVYQSGTSVWKKQRISRSGVSYIRGLLYMCAWSACRYNKACKALYERLRSNGKCHRLAMVAVGHKLVKQAFAVVKSGVPFDNDYQKKLVTK